MSVSKLTEAAVLGAGTMGTQIALSLALGGVNVSLWARREVTLQTAPVQLSDAFQFLVESDLALEENKSEVLGRISSTTNLSVAVSGAAFVIEAVTEDLEVKRHLLTQAEALADDDTIFSSTTSALSASEIQQVLKKPQNFCVAHYAQPAHLVKLVEIVPGKLSSETAVTVTNKLMVDTNKIPVRCPDIPGFLWARIQHAVLREFACLVGQGLVTPEACDTILKQGYAARLPAMGAFEHADLAGLDLMNGAAAKAVWADLNNVTDPAETPVGTLFQDGLVGMSGGQGFYDWNVRNPDEFKKQRDQEIVRRVKIQSGGEVVVK